MRPRRPIAVALLVVALTSFAPCSPASGGEDSALHWAAHVGDLEKVKELLQAGGDINAKGWRGTTPLDRAAAYGHREVVAFLIEEGADIAPDYRSDTGLTLLHAAARGGCLELARKLVEKGADIDAKGNDGRTPLDFAESNGYEEMAALLREHGGKRNRP